MKFSKNLKKANIVKAERKDTKKKLKSYLSYGGGSRNFSPTWQKLVDAYIYIHAHL